MAVEQACLPQSDTERFEILDERQLNRCFNAGNRFCTSALGNKGNKITEIVFIIGQVLCDYPAITFSSSIPGNTFILILLTVIWIDLLCLPFRMTIVAVQGFLWWWGLVFLEFYNRKCCKAKNVNCAFKWTEQRSHLFKLMLVLTCFSLLVPRSCPWGKTAMHVDRWCSDVCMFTLVSYYKKVLLFSFIESDPVIKGMFDASWCIFNSKPACRQMCTLNLIP